MAQAIPREFFDDTEPEKTGGGKKDLETLLSTFGENEENQQDLNFSQDNNLVPKRMFRNKEVTTVILK